MARIISEPKEIRYTVKQYAEKKGLHPQTVYRRIRAGLLNIEQLAPHYPYEIIEKKKNDSL